MQPLRPAISFALPADLDPGRVVAFDVDHAGDVWCLEALAPPDDRTGDGPDRPRRYRARAFRDGVVVRDVHVASSPFDIHHVQPLGDGLLLVCARSRRFRDGTVEQNARVHGADGRARGAFCMGDGIASVQATAGGDIWAAYFDEGILGNFGWNAPLGASGIVCWSRDGAQRKVFDPRGRAPAIDDCYAMNVDAAGDIWACYYADFPLVRWSGDDVRLLGTAPVSGASAFAVDGRHALFFGGRGRGPASAALVRLATMKVAVRYRLVDADGRRLAVACAVGRGAALTVLAGGRVHRYALTDAAPAPG